MEILAPRDVATATGADIQKPDAARLASDDSHFHSITAPVELQDEFSNLPPLPNTALSTNVVISSTETLRHSSSAATTTTCTTKASKGSTVATSILYSPALFFTSKIHVAPKMDIDPKLVHLFETSIMVQFRRVLKRDIPSGSCAQDLYMAGKNPLNLGPTLVVTCGDKRILRRVRKVFAQQVWLKKLLKEHGITFVAVIQPLQLTSWRYLRPTCRSSSLLSLIMVTVLLGLIALLATDRSKTSFGMLLPVQEISSLHIRITSEEQNGQSWPRTRASRDETSSAEADQQRSESSSTPSPAPSPLPGQRYDTGVIVGIIVGSLAGVLLLAFCFFYLLLRRRRVLKRVDVLQEKSTTSYPPQPIRHGLKNDMRSSKQSKTFTSNTSAVASYAPFNPNFPRFESTWSGNRLQSIHSPLRHELDAAEPELSEPRRRSLLSSTGLALPQASIPSHLSTSSHEEGLDLPEAKDQTSEVQPLSNTPHSTSSDGVRIDVISSSFKFIKGSLKCAMRVETDAREFPYGQQITIRSLNDDNMHASCTAGGVIFVREQPYVLTAGHPFVALLKHADKNNSTNIDLDKNDDDSSETLTEPFWWDPEHSAENAGDRAETGVSDTSVDLATGTKLDHTDGPSMDGRDWLEDNELLCERDYKVYSHGRSLCVLLVVDDPSLYGVVRDALQSAGIHRVRRAYRAQDVSQMMRTSLQLGEPLGIMLRYEPETLELFRHRVILPIITVQARRVVSYPASETEKDCYYSTEEQLQQLLTKYLSRTVSQARTERRADSSMIKFDDAGDWALLSSGVLPQLARRSSKTNRSTQSSTLAPAESIQSVVHLASSRSSGDVNVLFGDHPRSGSLRRGLTNLMIDGISLDVQLVVMEERLPPGCSGAWVVNDDTLCGYIISARADVPWAYMLPIQGVVDSIKKKYDTDDVHLPTPADMHDLEVAYASAFKEPRHENHVNPSPSADADKQFDSEVVLYNPRRNLDVSENVDSLLYPSAFERIDIDQSKHSTSKEGHASKDSQCDSEVSSMTSRLQSRLLPWSRMMRNVRGQE